jgi:hypothetical protein
MQFLSRRLLPFPQTISTSKLRLRITESPACIAITEPGVYGPAGL